MPMRPARAQIRLRDVPTRLATLPDGTLQWQDASGAPVEWPPPEVA